MMDDCGLDCGECLRCEELFDLLKAQIAEERRREEEYAKDMGYDAEQELAQERFARGDGEVVGW